MARAIQCFASLLQEDQNLNTMNSDTNKKHKYPVFKTVIRTITKDVNDVENSNMKLQKKKATKPDVNDANDVGKTSRVTKKSNSFEAS